MRVEAFAFYAYRLDVYSRFLFVLLYVEEFDFEFVFLGEGDQLFDVFAVYGGIGAFVLILAGSARCHGT